jgi:predicted amidohydrolase/GNAT superfamily N-acetyltransferase
MRAGHARCLDDPIGMSVSIRTMAIEDVPAVVELQTRIFPGMSVWSAENLLEHMRRFPEGQLVGVDGTGRIVASASSLIIDWDDYGEQAQWATITSHGTFSTHNPLGKTLYGADMGVAAEARGQGLGSMLYEARKRLVRERSLKRLLTGGRIPGYAAVAREVTPERYVSEVVSGRRKDPTLSFQLANGMVVLDVVHNYMTDPDSGGNATLLEWLNPDYRTSVSLDQTVYSLTSAEPNFRACRQTRSVRIAAVQYNVRPIDTFTDFAARVEFFVNNARDYGCQFVLFPEYFTMQLLSFVRQPAAGRAVRLLAELTPRYEALFQRLATSSGLYIVAGTHPVIEEGQLFNAAHFFTPQGHMFRQKKVHLTPTETGPYQMSRGNGFHVYHSKYGTVAILVCYDVEFPEAARVVAEAGTEILFVPSCTDDRQGYCRVRYCAQARAIENQLYVVVTGTVGNLPQVPHMAINYGQAAILTPSDYHFARDGLAAEGVLNQEQMIVADVDLERLDEQNANGTVVPLQDHITDAYDRVVHYSDPVEEPGSEPSRVVPASKDGMLSA